MKAAVYVKYGPPEVIEVREVPRPGPKRNEVLVKVRATTVNRTDCGFRKPEYPFIIRPINGLIRPKKTILGSEFSGEVAETGAGVKSFKPGDAVFGLSTLNFGAHAEYICVPENGSIAMKPDSMTHAQAAAVCDGLMLAKAYIKEIDFASSPKMLINGGSGSIGSAAVQLARYYGADITAVCGTKNIDLVRSLGAENILDYTREDFTKTNQRFDVVFDAVGKSSFFKCRNILKEKGVYFSTDLGFLAQNIFLALLTPLLGGKKVKFPVPKDSKADIEFFRRLIEAGNYKAVIDRTYPLDRIVEAAQYVEAGQKTGNVVILVGEDAS